MPLAPSQILILCLVLAAGGSTIGRRAAFAAPDSVASATFVEWHSLEKAQRLAKENTQLIIVVQGPDDCTLQPAECPTAAEYLTATIPDNGLRAFFEFRAVFHYRPTGPLRPQAVASRHQSNTKRRSKPISLGNAKAKVQRKNTVTYFCTPDLEILDFIVGYPSPAQLQATTDWTYQLARKTRAHAPYERLEKIAQAHTYKLQTSGVLTDSRNITTQGQRRTLSELIKVVANDRDSSIVRRFGAGWSNRDRQVMLATVRLHGDVAAHSSHHIFRAYPAPKLNHVEQLVFEAFTRQTYWPPPIRRQPIREWFRQQQALGRPILLVVSPHAVDRPISASATDLLWHPKRDAVKELVSEFAALDVERTELFCLLSDIELTRSTSIDFNRIRLLVFAADADDRLPQPYAVDQDKNESQIQRVLAKAVSRD